MEDYITMEDMMDSTKRHSFWNNNKHYTIARVNKIVSLFTGVIR